VLVCPSDITAEGLGDLSYAVNGGIGDSIFSNGVPDGVADACSEDRWKGESEVGRRWAIPDHLQSRHIEEPDRVKVAAVPAPRGRCAPPVAGRICGG
jgi:hypothetical protein